MFEEYTQNSMSHFSVIECYHSQFVVSNNVSKHTSNTSIVYSSNQILIFVITDNRYQIMYAWIRNIFYSIQEAWILWSWKWSTWNLRVSLVTMSRFERFYCDFIQELRYLTKIYRTKKGKLCLVSFIWIFQSFSNWVDFHVNNGD